MTRGSTATVPTWEEENNNALRGATNPRTNHFKNKQIGTIELSTAATESAHLTTCLIYFQMSNQVGPVGAVVPDKRQGASLGSGVKSSVGRSLARADGKISNLRNTNSQANLILICTSLREDVPQAAPLLPLLIGASPACKLSPRNPGCRTLGGRLG
jgi:hypothetical protein